MVFSVEKMDRIWNESVSKVGTEYNTFANHCAIARKFKELATQENVAEETITNYVDEMYDSTSAFFDEEEADQKHNLKVMA